MATGVMTAGDEPGESEFAHGKGLMASPKQRGQYVHPIDPLGPWEPSIYEQAAAVRRTDPAYASTAKYDAAPESVDNTTTQNWVRE